ncbi:TonB-dependent receptor plug domain-containing protein [Frigoriflavimonas asaccharolytica]|uniref:TonB-dependent receptor plug domain-containing protein n=1 Tax=Frigoriflavimonas asaccharolytica TaxID=2735899 RepID=A0A8J8GAW9_9FLAO|nr:TonB-dependent receptor plug domain-containing protein [Frigoriflavimonas asaccharolytica]NRS92849.1 hypothetical protein [Frigoriflavimonas asaccharolytica]
MKKYIFCTLSIVPTLFFAQKKDTLKTQYIEEVVFQRKGGSTSDLTNVRINAREASQIVSASGGIEGMLKTLPSVNSNSELSSQYMVRGGNYDENLVYINDIEIYRPQLIRDSQQEGLSIINPDMVSFVNFSAGGFEAKYGDKMSSALNIYYREPTKFEVSGEASLIGGRLSTGFATENKKFNVLFSGRYRNTNLLLNTQKGETDFNPQYVDFQSYMNYHISPKLSLSFLGIYSKNDFEVIPKQKTVDFGSVLQPLKVDIFYNGREDDQYKNMMGTFSINYKPTEKLNISLNSFAYQNREREYYTIASAYRLQAFDPATGEPVVSYDVGGQIDNARNDLLVKTYGAQLRAKYALNVNTNFEFGGKYERESLRDFTNEYKLQDSIGYSVPRPFTGPRDFNDGNLDLKYLIRGDNNIQPTRTSAYLQFSHKMFWGSSKVNINAGARVAHWDFNDETIFSPRAQFAIKPNWDADMLFRVAGGIYYQAPFYKEIKDLEGNFNPNIKSQKSTQIIVANDYEFEMYERPFKLTTELYYKKLDNLIPYYLDNVRIRYTGLNNATGYSYGVDARLNGEFVPGVDSWLSASYARSFENIDNKGDIPRPTDQNFRFAIFYQDYMPSFPKMRVNLTGTYAMGLPTGSPLFSDPYLFEKTLSSYKRVDIGLSYVFVDSKENNNSYGFLSNFDELTLGVQIFNAFNIYNTIANNWITDVNSSTIFPVPVNLTGRFFNVKLEFRL